MTPTEWDNHKRNWCESCTYTRRCSVKAMLEKNPSDEIALCVIRRLGRCSQYVFRQKKSRNKR